MNAVLVCDDGPASLVAVTQARVVARLGEREAEVVAPGMSPSSSCHWYANVRGARKRKAPARSDFQLPGLQLNAAPRLAPPEIAGA